MDVMDDIAGGLDALFGEFNQWAIHTPKQGDPVRRRVILSEGVERQGDQVGVMLRRDEMDVLLTEGPRPRRGDTIQLECAHRVWTVDGESAADGRVCTVIVR